MCVLRDSYLIDDQAYFEPNEEQKTNLQLVKKTVEVKKEVQIFVTTHFWCRTCKGKVPVEQTKTCDCGMIMCGDCWNEWELTCPICDKTIG